MPGIGPATEKKLWSDGLTCWEDYLNNYQHCHLPPALRHQTIEHLEGHVFRVVVNIAPDLAVRQGWLQPGDAP